MGSKGFYHFEDFVLDDSFREYLLKSNEKSVEYWEEWIGFHPELKNEINRASEVVLTLSSKNQIPVAADSKAELKKLLRRIHSDENKGSVIRRISFMIVRVAAIVLLCLGMIWIGYVLSSKGNSKSETVSYNEIIVPVGEKSQIILSDGTHVWINSGSTFRYPADFGIKSRQVLLEGEAYFDVTKSRKEFIVSTHDVDIEVLGTAFNVKSYPEDERTQTTVVRGRVKVLGKEKGTKPVLIGPDQMAVLRADPGTNLSSLSRKNIAILNNVNTIAVTSWKDQLLVFADETFEDLAVKMERWYNIQIRIDDKTLKKERYTGKFVNNETVYQVLEAISLTTSIQYTVKDDEIVISRK